LIGEKELQEDQLTPAQALPVLIQLGLKVLIEEELHTVVLNQLQQEVVHTIVEPALKTEVVMVVKVNQDVLLMKIADLQAVIILLVIIAHPAVAIVEVVVPAQEKVVLPEEEAHVQVEEVHALAVAEDNLIFCL
jgi:hypothetical protein